MHVEFEVIRRLDFPGYALLPGSRLIVVRENSRVKTDERAGRIKRVKSKRKRIAKVDAESDAGADSTTG
jgi:hypothetical protein